MNTTAALPKVSESEDKEEGDLEREAMYDNDADQDESSEFSDDNNEVSDSDEACWRRERKKKDVRLPL